jgi:hypothetical protein
MRQYAIDHPNIRMKELVHHGDDPHFNSKHEGPFGRKSEL